MPLILSLQGDNEVIKYSRRVNRDVADVILVGVGDELNDVLGQMKDVALAD